MWVQSLGWEDTLKKEMAIQFNILAWKIPRTEETGRLQSIVSQKSRSRGGKDKVKLYKWNMIVSII